MTPTPPGPVTRPPGPGRATSSAPSRSRWSGRTDVIVARLRRPAGRGRGCRSRPGTFPHPDSNRRTAVSGRVPSRRRIRGPGRHPVPSRPGHNHHGRRRVRRHRRCRARRPLRTRPTPPTPRRTTGRRTAPSRSSWACRARGRPAPGHTTTGHTTTGHTTTGHTTTGRTTTGRTTTGRTTTGHRATSRPPSRRRAAPGTNRRATRRR